MTIDCSRTCRQVPDWSLFLVLVENLNAPSSWQQPSLLTDSVILVSFSAMFPENIHLELWFKIIGQTRLVQACRSKKACHSTGNGLSNRSNPLSLADQCNFKWLDKSQITANLWRSIGQDNGRHVPDQAPWFLSVFYQGFKQSSNGVFIRFTNSKRARDHLSSGTTSNCSFLIRKLCALVLFNGHYHYQRCSSQSWSLVIFDWLFMGISKWASEANEILWSSIFIDFPFSLFPILLFSLWLWFTLWKLIKYLPNPYFVAIRAISMETMALGLF